MKPACWNREPFTDPNAGWENTFRWARATRPLRLDRTNTMFGRLGLKPIYRYRHPWFTDRCTVHDKADIGPGLTYAQHYGWDCSGCKHKPEGV